MAINQKNIIQMQLIKFDLFKSQDPETGRYDTVFDVGGKIIYAHKNMLNMVSQTFDAMLSDRWNTNKNEPIKIKDYSFDDFYQFLSFLYSGQCELTDSNIFSMVDIAEFYGVQIFKNYCEEYLTSMEIKTENVFQLMKLLDKYSMVQLKSSAYRFIKENFRSFADSDGFLKVNKSVLKEIVISDNNNLKPEILFQAVYKWAEKQAMEKQTAKPNLNLNETIKNEISDFLPYIQFDKMELHFLHEFVVSRGFIFSSWNEVSKILCDRHPKTEVKVTNSNGEFLHGIMVPDDVFIKLIKSLNGLNSTVGAGGICWWTVEKLQLSAPSPLKKRDGHEWYLTYDFLNKHGFINVKHCSLIADDDYILAELATETSGFEITSDSKISML